MVLQVFNIKKNYILFNDLNLGCIPKIFLNGFVNFSLDVLIKEGQYYQHSIYFLLFKHAYLDHCMGKPSFACSSANSVRRTVIKGCLVLWIFFKQQLSSFELYFCFSGHVLKKKIFFGQFFFWELIFLISVPDKSLITFSFLLSQCKWKYNFTGVQASGVIIV